MITEIGLRNFKSFEEARFPLGQLTLLIGPNASGKSNLLDALRLLAWLAPGRFLYDLTRQEEARDVPRGRPGEWPHVHAANKRLALWCSIDAESPLRWEVEIEATMAGAHIVNERLEEPSATVPLYEIVAGGEYGRDVAVAYDNFSRGGKKPQVPCIDQQVVLAQLASPARFDAKHRVSQEKIPVATSLVRAALGNVLFLDPVPSSMRGYVPAGDPRLRSDGGNLASVLHHIVSEAKGKSEALEFVRHLPEQDVVDVDFVVTPRNEVMVKLVETFGGQRVEQHAPSLSDGTLRVLSIAAALLSAEPDSLVIIEEVDNGVHSSRAKHLLESISRVAEQRRLRIVLSTHNPALLDALPPASVPDVVCCYRDKLSGASRLARLGDLENAPKLLAADTLGSLATAGAIERFLRGDLDSNESEQLNWLRELIQRARA